MGPHLSAMPYGSGETQSKKKNSPGKNHGCLTLPAKVCFLISFQKKKKVLHVDISEDPLPNLV